MAHPLFPAVRIVVVIITGIFLADGLPVTYDRAFLVFLCTLILTLMAEVINQRFPQSRLTSIVIIGYHLSLLSFSASHYLLVEKQRHSVRYLQNLNSFYDIPLHVEARLLQISSKSSDIHRVLVETSHILFQGDTLTTRPVKMTLNWPESVPKPKIDERIKATIRLKEWMGLKNPFVFNYQSYLENQGVLYAGKIDQLHRRSRNTSSFTLLATKNVLIESLEDLFSETSIPIAKALLIGEKGSLTENTKEDFRRSGLSHLMAVSGLHVVFVVSPLLLFIPFTYGKPVYRHALFGAIVGVLILYSGITGNSASVLRAALMFGVYSFARIYRWIHHGLNTLAGSAIVLLLYNPTYIWDIGFQLSFLAVFSIIVSNPLIQQTKPIVFHKPILTQLWDIVGISTMIQLALTPLLLFHFGALSFSGLLLNVVAIPLTQGILSSSMLILLFYAGGAPVGALAKLVDYAIQLLAYIAQLGSSWAISQWIIPALHWSLLLLFFLMFILLISLNNPFIRWKLLCALLMLLLVFQIHQLVNEQKGVLLHVLFLDVGQGDAALVWTDAQHAMLIDTGVLNQEYNSGKAVIGPILQHLGIKRLNKVIVSHPHLDHMGGVLSLLNSIPIDTLYEADMASPSVFVLSYRTQARLKGTTIKTLKGGDRLFFSDHTRAHVLAPKIPSASKDPNTNSIMLKLTVGNISFLFTGDADNASEQQVVRTYAELLRSTVLKSGHHGSKTSSSEVFLNRVKPDWVVVSLGWKNKYNHPHPEVIARIKQLGTTNIHYTSLQGALWLTTDGYSISKQSY